MSQVAVPRHARTIEVRDLATHRAGTIDAGRSSMTKPYLALALVLGLSACVDEDETITVPPTQDEDEVAGEQEPGVPVDPPGDNVPGKGDGCGAQVQGDSTCPP